jgi:hypothetical protein
MIVASGSMPRISIGAFIAASGSAQVALRNISGRRASNFGPKEKSDVPILCCK